MKPTYGFERKFPIVTKFGSKLVAAAQAIEEVAIGVDRYERASEVSLSGPIKLSIPDVIGQYLLRDEIAEFCRTYPNINLRIETSYSFADLDRSEADVVIRGTDSPPDHLVGRCLFPYALSYYCHRDYLEQTDVADLRWIGGPHEPSGLRKLM